MQSKLTFVSSWLLATFVLGGCGDSPAVTCQAANCSTGTKTYQVCTNVDASVSYDFGGMSCTCASNDQQACEQCSKEVAAYCGASGTGGSGGTGGGHVTCTATFSGAVTGQVTDCYATLTYSAAANTTTLAITGDQIGGTGITWSGADMTLSGQAATGTFDQTAALASTAEVVQTGAANPPTWIAAHGTDQTLGTMFMTLTSLGPSQALSADGSVLYGQPHGTVTATLQDQNPSTAQPSLMLTVTF